MQPQSTLDLTHLDQAVYSYLKGCVTPSTLSSYKSAQRRYLTFCQEAAVRVPFPVREESLCRYAAYLGQQSLKYRTIKAYLSALRFGQIHQGLGDPFRAQSMPRLEYVLAGIKRAQARAHIPPKPRLHITPAILT